MFEKVKELLKEFAIYGLGELFNRALQIMIIPLIFVYLSKDEYGILEFFLTSRNLGTVIFGWGMMTAVMRYGARIGSYKPQKVNFNSLILLIVINLCLNLILFGYLKQINNLFFTQDLTYAFVLTSISTVIFAIRTIPLSILRMKQQPAKFVSVSFSYFLFYMGITYIMIKYYNFGYLAFLYSNIISTLISTLVAFAWTYKEYEISFDLKIIDSLFKFGTSILATSVCANFIIGSNRFFLKTSSGLSDLAILGMANKFSLAVGAILISPFSLAWLPFINSIYKTPHFKRIVQNVYLWYSLVAFLLILVITFSSSSIFLIFHQQKYLDSVSYIPMFALSYLFLGYYYIFSAGIYISGQSKWFYLISLLVTGSNVLLYIIFAKYSSVLSVSLITLFSHMMLAVMAWYYGNDVLEIKLADSRMVKLLILTLICVLALKANEHYFHNRMFQLLNEISVLWCLLIVSLRYILLDKEKLQMFRKKVLSYKRVSI